MKFKWKEPKTKIFKYGVGFFPAPSRDDGIGVDIEVHLCCNEYSYWLSWTDGRKTRISVNEFKEKYSKAFEQFQNDLKTLKRGEIK